MKAERKHAYTAAAVIALILLLIMTACFFTEDAYALPSASGKNTKLKVKSIVYKPTQREVRFVLNRKVQYRNLKIKITDGISRKNYVVSLNVVSPTKIDTKVRKLKYGREYNYVISGIRKVGSVKYVKLKGTFRALDR